MFLTRRQAIKDRPNPWAGHQACPVCGDSKWTMPFNGDLNDHHWVCVDRRHDTVNFNPDQLRLFET